MKRSNGLPFCVFMLRLCLLCPPALIVGVVSVTMHMHTCKLKKLTTSFAAALQAKPVNFAVAVLFHCF